MSFRLIETYSEGEYREVEVFQCSNCGQTFHIESGGDIACCPCEFREDFADEDDIRATVKDYHKREDQ